MWIPTGVLEGNLKSNSSVTIKAVSVAHTIRTVSRLPKNKPTTCHWGYYLCIPMKILSIQKRRSEENEVLHSLWLLRFYHLEFNFLPLDLMGCLVAVVSFPWRG